MPERERKQKPAPEGTREEVVEDVAATSERGEKLKEDIDDLLDEIDSVLEDNAEEFVRNYVQKGGQSDHHRTVRSVDVCKPARLRTKSLDDFYANAWPRRRCHECKACNLDCRVASTANPRAAIERASTGS